MKNYLANKYFLNYVYKKVTSESLPKDKKNFLSSKERISLILSSFATVFIPTCVFIANPVSEFNPMMIYSFCGLLATQVAYIVFKKIKHQYYNYDNVLNKICLDNKDIDYLSSVLNKKDMKMLLNDTESKDSDNKVVHQISKIFTNYKDLETWQLIANGEDSILIDKATIEFKKNRNLDKYLEHVYSKDDEK